MLLEEFLEIKRELVDLVIDFEQTERKISILNNIYILEFFEDLEQQRYIQCENNYLTQAIAMTKDGKSDTEVQAFLEQCRQEFSEFMKDFYRQHNAAKDMQKDISKYAKDDFEKIDQEFKEYCMVHHPLVKAHYSEMERNIYSMLIMLYRLGNTTAFRKMLHESSSSFTSPEVKPEEFETISKLYEETIQHLKSLKEHRNEVFPLNIEDIFYKEELLTREQISLRERNYQYREINKALHADFKLHFSFEFNL